MPTAHFVLNTLVATASLLAAGLWYKSATVQVLSPNTSGWGSLVGGYIVVPGPRNERVDLVQTVRLQSIWNRRAAVSAALAALLAAFGAFAA